MVGLNEDVILILVQGLPVFSTECFLLGSPTRDVGEKLLLMKI